MQPQNYNVVGVMSGTSLDGIDLAHTTLSHDGQKFSFVLHHCTTVPYPPEWVTALRDAVNLDDESLAKLNIEYTRYLGSVIANFIGGQKITPDAVCSHGHTVRHRPDAGYTLQIGNLPEIAEYTGQKVVCDFRVADVLLGGLGAFAENMAMEYRLGGRVVRTHDFQEGVRAVIVDKDNAPKWSPADLAGVTDAQLDALFAPLPTDEEWTPLS